MSDLELEQAAMAPRRWINLCASVFEKHKDQDHGDSNAILCPRKIRIIKDATNSALFIVPGGRYLVSTTAAGLFVWDLGYVSSANCTLLASVEPRDGSLFEPVCQVQATADGMGLIILVLSKG